MTEDIVEISGLSKYYYKRSGLFSREKILALDNLSFSIKRGEIFGLLGPNGAGKTTALNIISGLIKQSSGQVKVLEEGPGSKTMNNKFKIGYLSEENILPDYLNTQELLFFLANVFGLGSSVKNKRISWLNEQLELASFFKKRIQRLSAGQKRLAGLACAFINDPQLLILDEPTVYLDPLGVRKLADLISSFKDQGKTVIISSHVLSQVEKLCGQIAILKQGKLRFNGDTRSPALKGSLEDAFIELTAD